MHAEGECGQTGEGGEEEHLETHYAKAGALDRLT
jgi:hypothetical protein